MSKSKSRKSIIFGPKVARRLIELHRIAKGEDHWVREDGKVMFPDREQAPRLVKWVPVSPFNGIRGLGRLRKG